MYITDLIDNFLEFLEIERGRSLRTIANYRLYLERFAQFADDHRPADPKNPDQDSSAKPSDITPDLIRQYRLYLNRYKDDRGQTLSIRTQTYYIIALRQFLKYLARRDIKSLDAAKIDLPKVVRPQVSFLQIDEVERILNEIPPDNLRDQAILQLLFSSGLRVSELVALDRGQINLERREFVVRGKGDKDRPVFLSPSAAETISDYLATRNDQSKALFINYRDKITSPNPKEKDDKDDKNSARLTARSVQRLVDKYSKLAGITKKVTPHTMRHSFATDLLMNGADLRSVQGLLGHADISTTQVYTHLTDQHLKEIHDRFHTEGEH
ncbi:tyrosine-type recombinase/integrase [Candidatus Saccharibacteria bacterium]|nr:tyrosine-type recombinase/integrase [Candidatus Saccharibacteria bacterium]